MQDRSNTEFRIIDRETWKAVLSLVQNRCTLVADTAALVQSAKANPSTTAADSEPDGMLDHLHEAWLAGMELNVSDTFTVEHDGEQHTVQAAALVQAPGELHLVLLNQDDETCFVVTCDEDCEYISKAQGINDVFAAYEPELK